MIEQKEKYKILVIATLLGICCVLTYYFHAVLDTGKFFTHLFYVPIILASLWWKRKGLVVAIFLAVFLIFSHLFVRGTSVTVYDYPRSFMFIVIGLVVAELSERMAKALDERKRAEEELRKLSEELERKVEERTKELVAEQQLVLELSTPVIHLWDEIVLVPLIGTIDTRRAQQIMENLLQAIVDKEARVAILDITGVPMIDTDVARHLLTTVQAAGMLGATAIITGISPKTALTMTRSEIDISGLICMGSLRYGIREALKIIDAEAK